MYGGRVLENLCQAIAREILVELLLALEQRGYRIIGHCHDEVLIMVPDADVPRALVEICDLAERSPTWAPQLPLKVEAFATLFWGKDPLPGMPTIDDFRTS
jgi:DNA polymerase